MHTVLLNALSTDNNFMKIHVSEAWNLLHIKFSFWSREKQIHPISWKCKMIQVMLTEPHAASKTLLKIKLFDPITWHASYYVSFEHKMSSFIWNLPEPCSEYQTNYTSQNILRGSRIKLDYCHLILFINCSASSAHTVGDTSTLQL